MYLSPGEQIDADIRSVWGCGVDMCVMCPCLRVWSVVYSRYRLLLCGGLWCIPQVLTMLQGLMHHIALQQRVTLDHVLSFHLQD